MKNTFHVSTQYDYKADYAGRVLAGYAVVMTQPRGFTKVFWHNSKIVCKIVALILSRSQA